MIPITLNSTIIKSPDQISTDLGGEAIILGLKSEAYFSLEGVGLRLWEWMAEPKSGAVRIASQTGAPLVPSAVIGIPELHKEWKNPLRRTPLTVRFGEPIHFTGDPDDSAAIQHQSVELMHAIARLLPTELRGRYGERE